MVREALSVIKPIKQSKIFLKEANDEQQRASNGFPCLDLFIENLNAQKMLQKRGLLRSATMMFGADTAGWILQEDNDPKYRSRPCTAWKSENGITTLDWPSQSPNANPIENAWSV